jgi:hypothetical protein
MKAGPDTQQLAFFIPPTERLTLREAVTLLTSEGLNGNEVCKTLQSALIMGRLNASDRKGRNHFRYLDNYLPALAHRGVAEADLNVVSVLGRGFAIPPETWRQWFTDGSVNWETGEVPRAFGRHVETFTPMLPRDEVLALFTRFEPATSVRPASIKPKFKDAPLDGEAIREAIRTVNSRFFPGKAPNLNDLVQPVQHLLNEGGLKASKARIQELAGESEFKSARGEVGKHR